MNSYIGFKTALVYLVIAYLMSVTILLVAADMALAAMGEKPPRANATIELG